MASTVTNRYWWLSLIPRILSYKLFRVFNVPKTLPISLTLSLTNRCNSRCKTCNIWKLYRGEIGGNFKEDDELRLEEYDSIFKSIGKSLIWCTFSGGEPYLREDIKELTGSLQNHCQPNILIIPTNGLLPTVIENKTRQILNILPQETIVIVNVSLDGVAEAHDEIRGVPGNFNKAIDSYKRLKKLKQEHKNLELGIHTVASKFNIDKLMGVYEFAVKELGPDSYISEIAEHRNELFNIDDDIAPERAQYEKVIRKLQKGIKQDYIAKGGIASLIQSFRLNYYDFVVEILEKQRQVVPCYAGVASGQISAYGDVWPCCILARNSSMGNLREVGYDLRKIWFSEKAQTVRRRIKQGECYCPMANVHYTNMLLSPTAMLKVLIRLVRKR